MSLLAILVHCVSYEAEVDVALIHEFFFVVSMRVDYGHEHTDEFQLLNLGEFAEDGFKVLLSKTLQKLWHAGLFLLLNPRFLERREKLLVKLSH